MIPTMILFGLVFGRWWRTALIVGAWLWPVILVAGDVIRLDWDFLSASGLGIANTMVGVLLHQAILRIGRQIRYEHSPL